MRVKGIIVAAMIGGTSLVSVGAAGAALSDCNSDKMCMWGNNDFAYLIGERNHGVETIYNMPSATNDEMDSWANRSASYTGCMYQHNDGGGDKQTMGRNSKDNNVAPFNSDEVSSWRSKYGC